VDREKSLEMALGQIDKTFGKGSIMRMGEKGTMKVESISTGALALDLALGIGGLPKGRVVEIFGPESSGKSTMAMHVVAALQWGDWDFTLSTQTVEVSDPVAVERGKYVLRFEAGVGAPPGMKSFEDRGNYLVHWRNEGGDWLVAADAPVSELPMPGAA
jgi:hypothetical protein